MTTWYRVRLSPHQRIEHPFETAKQFLVGILDPHAETRLVIQGGRETLFAVDVGSPIDALLVQSRMQTYYPGSQISSETIADPEIGTQWTDIAWAGPSFALMPPWPEERSRETVMNDLLLGVFSALHTEEAQGYGEAQIYIRAAPKKWARGLVQDADTQTLQAARMGEKMEAGHEESWNIPLLTLIGALALPLWWMITHRTLAQIHLQTAALHRWLTTGAFSWRPWMMYAPGIIVGIGLWFGALFLWLFLKRRAIVVIDPKRVLAKTQQPAYDVGIRCCAYGAAPETVAQHLAKVYESMSVAHGVRLRQGKIRHAEQGRRAQRPRGRILGIDELVLLWHIPGGEEGLLMPGVRYSVDARMRTAPQEMRGDRTAWAMGTAPDSALRNEEIPITMLPEQLRHHMLLVAKPGKGKSTLMAHLVMRAVEASDTGVVVIDPHGDLIEDLLPICDGALTRRVWLIDFSDATHVLGMNVLDVRLVADIGVHTNRILTIFKKYFEEAWGLRMEDAFSAAIRTLMLANQYLVTQGHPEWQLTLLDVPSLFLNPNFREAILLAVSEPSVLEWWNVYYPTLYDRMKIDVINPVLTKIAQFARSRMATAMVGLPTMDIPVRDIVRDNGICLVKGGNTILGSSANRLLLTIVVGLFEQAIAEQEQLAEQDRKHLLCVIDEFHSLSGIEYTRLLGELRKYGADIVLATQALGYLKRLDPSLLSTVLATTETIFAYSMSAEDAEVMSPECDNVPIQDLINQETYQCSVKTFMKGRRLPTFSMRVRQLPSGDPAVAANIRGAWNARSRPYEAAKYLVLELATRRATRQRKQARGMIDVTAFQPGVAETIVYPDVQESQSPPPPPPEMRIDSSLDEGIPPAQAEDVRQKLLRDDSDWTLFNDE